MAGPDFRAPRATSSRDRLLAGRSRSWDKSENNTQRRTSSPGTKSSYDKQTKEKEKTRSSDRSKSSQKSKKKDLAKGLSPPKETSKRPDPQKEEKSRNPPGNQGAEFDVTQWERTRWGEDVVGGVEKSVGEGGGVRKCNTRQRRSTGAPQFQPIVRTLNPTKTMTETQPQQSGTGTGEQQQQPTTVGKTVPGEARQVEQIRGEHLRARPKLTIILLSVEALFSAITVAVWSAAAVNPVLPFILALINALIIFGLCVTAVFVELFRFQVKKVEDESGKKQAITKYTVPYRWKFALLATHVGRVTLVCACITIMALDNDWDGGSIAVLALQPLHLLVIAVHIFIALRPKRKE